jgi:AhpD family alkylhydroperoxidase
MPAPKTRSSAGAKPKKPGLVSAVRKRKARATKPKSSFGGYRKRTTTAREFAGSIHQLMPQAHEIYRIWGRHEMDPGFREELMLAVAKLNDCRYCTWGHHEWAQLSGIPEEELAHIENMDPRGFDRSKWVAISYVRALVSANFGDVSPELREEMTQHYSAQEVREIELVARVMDVSNRGANTWDAMLSRINGNPANDSRLFDEIVMSGVFWTAAPVIVLVLARGSKRPYRQVWKSMLDYVTHYEASKPQSAA